MREHQVPALIINGSALLRDDIWQDEIMSWLLGGDFQGAPRPLGRTAGGHRS
jgi:hypothetical protein